MGSAEPRMGATDAGRTQRDRHHLKMVSVLVVWFTLTGAFPFWR